MAQVFSNVGGAKVGRSVFNLSYEKKFSAEMGKLIPTMCDEVIPGDVFSIGNNLVIRMQPLVSPVLHEINAYIHYFFVPYRLLMNVDTLGDTGTWEDFITGGRLGTDASTLPTWEPLAGENDIGDLWDYLGFPIDIDPDGAYPIDFPRRAYNFIYNTYYRDETLITEVALTDSALKIRAWEKDYFTSALPWQQRGTAPALPISGTTQALWTAIQATDAAPMQFSDTGLPKAPFDTGTKLTLEANTIDLSSATTFDVADLRLAFQIQKWLERNARAGARYTEFLKAHFGTAPRDDRLDRPEYIGGSKSPLVISEVLQTSETDTTPQGTLAGHGITVDRRNIGKYRATEFGLIMGILSIMPRTAYSQGINRQWLRETKYDFFFPEFANLSEQQIIRAELYASDVSAENLTVFGYQGRYDEMRYKPNMVCGELRDVGNLNYWTLTREFGGAPTLNQTFIEAVPRTDIFAVPGEPGFIVSIGNLIKAVRPIPIVAEPGLIDHV